ncbi:MAG TPA: hypothetical protein VIZ18_13580 [Ktedonobacteraceae bacterium]
MAKSKQGVCVCCGQVAELTEDHVIPQCLFPNGIPSDAPKVWACEPCNGIVKSRLDQYFRDLLVTDMHSSQSPVAQQLFAKFSRSVVRNQSKLARDMLQKAQLVELRTEGGLYAGEAYTTQEATAKTQEIMAMYVRGLYAFYIHNTLPHDTDFEFFRAGKSEKLNDSIGFLNENGGSYGRIGDGDIFECVFGHAADVPEAGIWILNFFRRALFVVVATPKNLAKSA